MQRKKELLSWHLQIRKFGVAHWNCVSQVPNHILVKRQMFWRYSVHLLGGHVGRLHHQVKILVPRPHLPSLLPWAQQHTEICHTLDREYRCIRQMSSPLDCWTEGISASQTMEGWFFSRGNAHECTMYYSSSHATEASCSCCLAAMQFAVEKQGRLCFWQASRQSVSWTLSTGWKSFKGINQPVVDRSHRPCRTLLISQSWSLQGLRALSSTSPVGFSVGNIDEIRIQN